MVGVSGAPVTPDEFLTFTYDALDRLTGVSKTFGDGYTGVYTYTQIGNLTGKTENGATLNYTYGATASGCVAGTPTTKPHAVTAAGSHTYTYNCNGGMTRRVEGEVTLRLRLGQALHANLQRRSRSTP